MEFYIANIVLVVDLFKIQILNTLGGNDVRVKCPNCGSADIYNYSRNIKDEDISCGISVVEYECRCGDCDKDFDCVVHYDIAHVEY